MRLEIIRTTFWADLDRDHDERVELWDEGSWSREGRLAARTRLAELRDTIPESARPELRDAGDTVGTVSYTCRMATS